MTNLSRSLVLGCSMLALAACGPEEIASPGTGGNVTINNVTNNPAPTPTPTPTPTTAPVVAAGGCPTIADQNAAVAGVQGLEDESTISNPAVGTFRVCALPARFTTSVRLPQIAGLVYRLPGRVDVGTDGGPAPDASDGLSDSNVVLTIDPGVIIYGQGAAFLNVNRGSDISAIGTATRPIIFTSRDNVVGAVDANSSGQWGGVILSGRAQVSECQDSGATSGTVQCQRQVEGEANPALYGGATNTDNSGTMRYVQIRYSGFNLSATSELQSLTTGGTGSGTSLSFIQSVNSSDDGVEFFGGRVAVKNLIVAGAEDDSLDMDNGAKVDMQFVIAAQRAAAGDSLIESDTTRGAVASVAGFTDTSLPRTATRLANATLIKRFASPQAIQIRGGSDMTIVNSLIIDSTTTTPCLRVDDATTITATADAATEELGAPMFASFAMQCTVDSRDGSGGGANAAAAAAFVSGGTGNNLDYTATLTNGYLGGASETGYTPIFNIAAFNLAPSTFFEAVTFIGAVAPANNWTAGWTCDSLALTMGNNIGSCLTLPVFS